MSAKRPRLRPTNELQHSQRKMLPDVVHRESRYSTTELRTRAGRRYGNSVRCGDSSRRAKHRVSYFPQRFLSTAPSHDGQLLLCLMCKSYQTWIQGTCTQSVECPFCGLAGASRERRTHHKANSPFLKKGKKGLRLTLRRRPYVAGQVSALEQRRSKSFLLLFSKKEGLAFFRKCQPQHGLVLHTRPQAIQLQHLANRRVQCNLRGLALVEAVRLALVQRRKADQPMRPCAYLIVQEERVARDRSCLRSLQGYG